MSSIETIAAQPTSERHGKIFESHLQVPASHYDKVESLGHFIIERLEKAYPDNIIFVSILIALITTLDYITALKVDATSGREWKGASLARAILNTAAALRDKHAIERGQAICISFEHSDYTCIVGLAAVCVGAVVSSSFHKDPYAELLYQAKRVEPRLLFCHRHNLDWARKLESDLGYEVTGIAMDDEDELLASYINYDYQSSPSRGLIPVACGSLEDDVCFITMTSGTTGRPKAIAVSHKVCLAGGVGFARRPRADTGHGHAQLNFACPASFDYVSGRLIILGAICGGYKAILINGFEPKNFLEMVQYHRINLVFLGAASFYSLITYEHLDKYDISSVFRVFPMGAKIVYADELERFFKNHPHIKWVSQGFGTSEGAGAAMQDVTPEEFIKDPHDNGPLLPLVRVKIVDPQTGELLGANQTGAIHKWTPLLFKGYYDVRRAREFQKQQTEGHLKPSELIYTDDGVFDEDGFYITGDLGYMDDREHLYIVGRDKELMSCRGAKKVVPQELEELLAEHPAVAKSCVIGVPHESQPALHCPRAFVVPKSACYNSSACKEDFLTTVSEMASDQGSPDSGLAGSNEPLLDFKGHNKLCSLEDQWRQKLAQDMMEFMNQRIGWEKQLTGGVVLLDEIPTLRATGKMNKNYLRGLTPSQVEIYGDVSAETN